MGLKKTNFTHISRIKMQVQADEPVQPDLISAYTRLLAMNKITAKNCFDLNLDHVSSLEQYSQIEYGENWQKVATHISAEARIFSIKVDTLHDDTTKIVNEFTRVTIDNEIRRQPTAQQLQGVREQLNRKSTGWAAIRSNLDPALKDEDFGDNQPFIRYFNTKKLMLDTLQLQPDLSLVVDFQAQRNDFSLNGTNRLPQFNLCSVRQLSIFSEFLSFRSDIEEFAQSLALSSKKESFLKQNIMDRDVMMNFFEDQIQNEEILSEDKDLKYENQESTLLGIGQSSIIQHTKNTALHESLFRLSLSKQNNPFLTNTKNSYRQPSDSFINLFDSRKDKKKQGKKVQRTRKKKSVGKFQADFDPEVQLSRDILQKIKIKRISYKEERQSNQQKYLVPMMFSFQAAYDKISPQTEQETVMLLNQQFSNTIGSCVQQKSKAKRCNFTIKYVKQQIWNQVKTIGCKTDIKTIFKPLYDRGMDIPFLWSALLHVAVQKELVLQGDSPNFDIDMI